MLSFEQRRHILKSIAESLDMDFDEWVIPPFTKEKFDSRPEFMRTDDPPNYNAGEWEKDMLAGLVETLLEALDMTLLALHKKGLH